MNVNKVLFDSKYQLPHFKVREDVITQIQKSLSPEQAQPNEC